MIARLFLSSAFSSTVAMSGSPGMMYRGPSLAGSSIRTLPCWAIASLTTVSSFATSTRESPTQNCAEAEGVGADGGVRLIARCTQPRHLDGAGFGSGCCAQINICEVKRSKSEFRIFIVPLILELNLLESQPRTS